MEQARDRPDAQRFRAEKRGSARHSRQPSQGDRDGEQDGPEEEPGWIEELRGEIEDGNEARGDGEDEEPAWIEKRRLPARQERKPDSRQQRGREPGGEQGQRSSLRGDLLRRSAKMLAVLEDEQGHRTAEKSAHPDRHKRDGQAAPLPLLEDAPTPERCAQPEQSGRLPANHGKKLSACGAPRPSPTSRFWL